MAINSSWIKTKVFLLAIMVTPIILLAVFGSGHHNFNALPEFDSNLNGEYVPMFPARVNFEDQSKKPFVIESLDNQIVLAGYHFINCKQKCTEASRRLMKVQYEYRKAKNVHVVQMMVGMGIDQSLGDYLDKYHINSDQWHVLKSTSNDSLLMAHRKSIIGLNQESVSASSIKHQQQMVLYDMTQRIRGFYNVSDSTEVNRLMDDIKVLKTQEWRKRQKEENS